MKLNDIKPKIYIMIGLPGSGKSTWIRTHLKNEDFILVSSDDIIDTIAAEQGITYSEAFKSSIGFATGEMKRIFDDAVKQNKNIVWDQTNVSKKKRKGILNKVPNNYKKIAVVFETEDAVIAQRLKTRAEETGKHIPSHVVDSMAKSWQSPTKEEGFDEIIKVR
jgi:predicted kinase